MKHVLLVLLSLVVITPAFAQEKTNGGRYQLIQLSNMRRDQYMLDTHTGKIWSKVCLVGAGSNGECDKTAWLADSVENVTAPRAKIYQEAESLEKFIETQKKSSSN